MELTLDVLELARNNLATFCMLVYPGFLVPPHVERLCETLEAVERGEQPRSMITMPPRHSKSLVTSQLFPAWYMGRNHGKNLMLVSHTAELATGFGRNVRNIMQSDIYKLIFPGVEITKDSKAKHRFDTTTKNAAFFLGVGGPITGRGGDCVIIDDPLKDAEQADSVAHKEMMRAWYGSVLYTRLMPGGSIVLVSTRWREDDLQGWLLDPKVQEKVEDWHQMNFPALAEADEYHKGKLIRRKGDPLWPEKFDAAALERIRSALGTRSFMALYQQRPQPQDGNIFKASWFFFTILRRLKSLSQFVFGIPR